MLLGLLFGRLRLLLLEDFAAGCVAADVGIGVVGRSGFVVVLPKECFELVRLPGTDLIVDVVILPQECFEFVRLP